jgi:hypothetical protein
MNEQLQTGLQRVTEWLSGEERVSRKLLVAGGILLLILLGVALD